LIAVAIRKDVERPSGGWSLWPVFNAESGNCSADQFTYRKHAHPARAYTDVLISILLALEKTIFAPDTTVLGRNERRVWDPA
jgi:hypothetical protein